MPDATGQSPRQNWPNEHRYECFQHHEWTTRPNVAGEPMHCPHCGTITLRRLRPDPQVVEALATVLWEWNAEHSKGLGGFPYERLIDVTKDDLRKLAKRMLPLARQVEPEHAEPPFGGVR